MLSEEEGTAVGKGWQQWINYFAVRLVSENSTTHLLNGISSWSFLNKSW